MVLVVPVVMPHHTGHSTWHGLGQPSCCLSAVHSLRSICQRKLLELRGNLCQPPEPTQTAWQETPTINLSRPAPTSSVVHLHWAKWDHMQYHGQWNSADTGFIAQFSSPFHFFIQSRHMMLYMQYIHIAFP